MITAPMMTQFIEYYEDFHMATIKRLDEKSKNLLLKLFDITDAIASNSEKYDRKSFYFHLPKGSFEEYKALYDETDENKLRKYFSRETDLWFQCVLLRHDGEQTAYGVWIKNSYVLNINDNNAVEWPETDASDLICALIEITEDVVRKLKAGTYNDWVRNNLSWQMRTGKVKRKDYWKAFPDEKEKYMLSEHETDVLKADIQEGIVPKTARQYYEACAVCYKAANLLNAGFRFTDSEEERARYGGITPKELYYSHADGRDENLSSVNLDSEEDFRKWLKHEEPYTAQGGHPFEIMFSWSGQTSIHLYLFDDRLYLSGGRYLSEITAMKMYVALIDAGYKAEFANGETILLRASGEGFVGIRPWFSLNEFEGDDIEDVVDIEQEAYEILKDDIIWFPPEEAKLKT